MSNNAENRFENNAVVLAGEVAGTPVYSHEVYGEGFYVRKFCGANALYTADFSDNRSNIYRWLGRSSFFPTMKTLTPCFLYSVLHVMYQLFVRHFADFDRFLMNLILVNCSAAVSFLCHFMLLSFVPAGMRYCNTSSVIFIALAIPAPHITCSVQSDWLITHKLCAAPNYLH